MMVSSPKEAMKIMEVILSNFGKDKINKDKW